MSKFLKKVGNFQANVGRMDASFGVISAYIFLALAIIASIVAVVYALIPMKPFGCDDNFPDPTGECKKKVRHYGLFWVLLIIPVAILIVYLSKTWKTAVDSNKSLAQLDGTFAEANMVKQFLQN